VNVHDFADIKLPAGDMLELIFNHQRDLMDKYHAIEETNVGHAIPSQCYPFNPPTPPTWFFAGALDINDRASQLRMKDFAWRITEELTEATLALGEDDETHYLEDDETHYLEELIDALHFSVELLILCGIEPEELAANIDGDIFESAFRESRPAWISKPLALAYKTVEKLGEAMNRLKLKPWKTTAMLTDEQAFHVSLTEFFAALIDLLKASGFTARSATVMYLQKNAVNQFRQRSNY
jgi:hypothetical protein